MTTKEELLEAFELFGKCEQFVMRHGSKHAYFVYSSEDNVDEMLRIHGRVPIAIRGHSLRIERRESPPYSMSGSLGDPLEQGKSLDQATSSAILEELTRTVPRFRGSQNPSRVIWMAGLPTRISRKALINFWSRLGCVVDVRPSLGGYAHVEFASTEEALRAVRQGVPHGFCYEERLLAMDFASWVFYVGPGYRAVHIGGWPASHGQPALLKWTHDIPNIVGATVLPPFRGEKETDPRSAFLRFKTTDDTRTALQMLDGRAGPGGKTLDMGLSRPLAVDPDQLWWWVNKVEEDMEKRGGEGGEVCLSDQWGGLGFGTGEEEQGVEH